jgi:hypothetical protein
VRGRPVRVTVDNFARAETDTYFAKFVKEGGFAKFHHTRGLAPIDMQSVIRMNRDTLYSTAVFDLGSSPVTVTLPDTGKRFLAVQVINEDHYTQEVVYQSGTHTVTKEKVGTRYVVMLVRIFVNPEDPADLKAVNALQDAIRVEQKQVGKFESPPWDADSLKKVRDALNALAAVNGGLDSARMFGRKDQVDPVQHVIGTAAGWGGNPPPMRTTSASSRRTTTARRRTGSRSRRCRWTGSGRSAFTTRTASSKRTPGTPTR